MDLKEQMEKLIDLVEETKTEMQGFVKTTDNLKLEIQELKEIIQMQSKKIEEVVNIHQNHLRKCFPVRTQEDLDKLEEELNESNKGLYVGVLKKILPDNNMQKDLTKVVSAELIMDYNLDGLQKRKRLLDYPNFLDILFKATGDGFPDFQAFLKELRKVIRMIKGRLMKCTDVKKLKGSEQIASTTTKRKIVLNASEYKVKQERNTDQFVVNLLSEDSDEFEEISF